MNDFEGVLGVALGVLIGSGPIGGGLVDFSATWASWESFG